MTNCDDCGRLVKTTRVEIKGDVHNLCDRCLRYVGADRQVTPGLCTVNGEEAMRHFPVEDY